MRDTVIGTWEQAVGDQLIVVKGILEKKHKDYGTAGITDFGLLGVMVRINDKLARLKNLKKNGIDPQNESARDSWVDIVGYGVIALMLLDGTFTLPMEYEIDAAKGQ